MRQAIKRIPDSAEKTVRDIRRNTRRHHSAEEKIRIVLEGLAVRSALPNSAARKASIRTSITGGPRSFWKPARNGWLATRPVRRPPTRSRSSRPRPARTLAEVLIQNADPPHPISLLRPRR